jgi:hypothetical protein
VVFDPLAAAEVAADMSLSMLLHPERSSRLADQSARQTGALDLEELLADLTAATLAVPATGGGADGEIRRMVADRTVDALQRLAVDASASSAARASAWAALERAASSASLRGDSSFARYQRARLEAFLEDPARYPPPAGLTAPAGSPIGVAPGGAACGWSDREASLVPR